MRFDTEDVIAVLDRIDLDRTNPGTGCQYTTEDGQHCIAGEILVQLGIEPPKNGAAMEGRIFNALPYRYIGDFTAPAIELIHKLQLHADHGHTWSTIREKILG